MSESKLQYLGSLGSKAKLIIANVAKYFLQESKKETSPASYIRRIVEAMGFNRTTVFKIRKEQMDTGVLRSPKRSGRGPYKPVDDFDETVIRNKIQEFCIVCRQLPTLKSLHEVLKTDVDFPRKLELAEERSIKSRIRVEENERQQKGVQLEVFVSSDYL